MRLTMSPEAQQEALGSPEALGEDVAQYFVAILKDSKSNDRYFAQVKNFGWESVLRSMSKGFCEHLGINNSEFKETLYQLLKMV